MDLIVQRLCDKYRVPYHVRRDIHMKMFDGRSAFDLMNADRLEQHHIDALIEEARQMKWQPIETAPTDGTRILLRGRNGKIADGHYGQPDGFANPKRFVWPYINATPTHWAPLALMDQSKAKPTNDSAPYQFELDFGDDDAP